MVRCRGDLSSDNSDSLVCIIITHDFVISIYMDTCKSVRSHCDSTHISRIRLGTRSGLPISNSVEHTFPDLFIKY